MKMELYVDILDETLLPFICDKFSDGNFQFMHISHKLGCK